MPLVIFSNVACIAATFIYCDLGQRYFTKHMFECIILRIDKSNTYTFPENVRIDLKL